MVVVGTLGVTDVHVHSYRQSLLDWLAVNIIAVVSLFLSRLDSTRLDSVCYLLVVCIVIVVIVVVCFSPLHL